MNLGKNQKGFANGVDMWSEGKGEDSQVWGLSSVVDTGVSYRDGEDERRTAGVLGETSILDMYSFKYLWHVQTEMSNGRGWANDKDGASSAEEGDTQISRNGYTYLESWGKKGEKMFQNQHQRHSNI